MAVSPNILHSFVIGDRLQVIADITGDTSYPTNGSPLDFTAAPFGFNDVHLVEPDLPLNGTRVYKYDYANKKLKAFSAFGTEVANATACNTDVVRVVVTGKGFSTSGV